MGPLKYAIALALPLVILSGGAARAEPDSDLVAASFRKFCEQWMSKLEDRRKFNLKRAEDAKPRWRIVRMSSRAPR
jgi:hypothetical protein